MNVPVWMVIATLLSWLPVGLGCYLYGWWWRGKVGERVIRVERVSKGEPLNDRQREAFDDAFAHMDRAFDAMHKVFDRG